MEKNDGLEKMKRQPDPVDSEDLEFYQREIPKALEALKNKPAEVAELVEKIGRLNLAEVAPRMDLRNEVIMVNDELSRAIMKLRSLAEKVK